MEKKIYENELFYILQIKSQIPWLAIYVKEDVKELSFLDDNTRKKLFELALIIEKQMLKYYKPTKINLASFANYLPKVHLHIMARFSNDAYFPECMWGVKQREEKNLNLPCFDGFVKALLKEIPK